MKNYDFFVGNKTKPAFLVEIIQKHKLVSIYKPDKYSKNEEFYEKFSLGKLVLRTNYDDVIFVKNPILYKNDFSFVPTIIFKIENKYLLVSNTIKEQEINHS